MSDSVDVVWVSPEALTLAARQAWVDDHSDATPGDVLDAIQQIEREQGNGEYRETTASGPVGPRHVWIDEHPDEPENPHGHFEAHDPDIHGAYQPQPAATGAVELLARNGGSGGTSTGNVS